MTQHIYLIGFMGTGKTTISHKLHELTGAKEVDMDVWIVEKNEMPINDMFENTVRPIFVTGRQMQSGRFHRRNRQSCPVAEVQYSVTRIHR